MKFCPECGVKLISQKFCHECGCNIGSIIAATSAATAESTPKAPESFDFSALNVAVEKQATEQQASAEEFRKYAKIQKGTRLVSYFGDASEITLPPEISSIKEGAFAECKTVEKINAVTKEDIINAANAVALDTVFFLKGGK